MLDQSINEARACAANKNLLERLLMKTEQLLAKSDEIGSERLTTVKAQAKTIARFEQTKCSETKIFWVYKRKTCY